MSRIPERLSARYSLAQTLRLSAPLSGLLLASAGRWLERRHVFVSLALLWGYTLFWAFLPVIGFGHYGPEPYGTSCTVSW